MTFQQIAPDNLLVAVNPVKYSVERILYFESKLKHDKKVPHVVVVEKTDCLLQRCEKYFIKSAHDEYERLRDSFEPSPARYLLLSGMYVATAMARCELPVVCKVVKYSFASDYIKQRKAIERLSSRLLKGMMVNDMYLTVFDLANYSLPP